MTSTPAINHIERLNRRKQDCGRREPLQPIQPTVNRSQQNNGPQTRFEERQSPSLPLHSEDEDEQDVEPEFEEEMDLVLTQEQRPEM